MKIVILSRSVNIYSTRRLMDTALARGHEVEVVDHLRCMVLVEEGRPAVRYQGKLLENVDAIIPRIGTSVTFYGCSIVRQFEMMRVFSTVHSDAIQRSRDKLRTVQLLSMAGVGMPKTTFTRQNTDAKDMIRYVGGPPVVIKLLEGTQGLGVVLAETDTAAKSVIEAFHALDANILVQEFIAEARSQDIRAFVVGGEVVGAMIRKGSEDDFRSNLHRGGTARAVQLTREERNTAIKAARALGLGVAGVDMLPSRRGPLVIEVNSSPGLEGIEAATQVDVAGHIIRYIESSVARRRITASKKRR
ncbi:MAG: 30S ribosomal protein S6--L-glutamate ligase [Bacteroidota bacterium]